MRQRRPASERRGCPARALLDPPRGVGHQSGEGGGEDATGADALSGQPDPEAEAGGEAQPRARVDGGRVSWVDDGLRADSRYRYTLRPLTGSAEGAPSAPVEVRTAATPPACDPYFSLARGVPVTRSGRPTKAVCP